MLSVDLLNLNFNSSSSSMVKGNQQEPFGLHVVMFIPSLRRLCDPQQAKKWLPLAESFQVLGTYAQTEMGHGQSWMLKLSYLLNRFIRPLFDVENKHFLHVKSFGTNGERWKVLVRV